MSRQFRIYATPADMLGIEEIVDSLAQPYVIVERRRRAAHTTLVADFASSTSLQFYITLAKHVDTIEWLPLKNDEEYLDVLRSPLIEISRPYFDGTKMSLGRLYCPTRYYDESGAVVLKPPDFLTWVDRVFRSVKKHLAYEPGMYAYVGPGGAAWLRDNPHSVDAGGYVRTPDAVAHPSTSSG